MRGKVLLLSLSLVVSCRSRGTVDPAPAPAGEAAPTTSSGPAPAAAPAKPEPLVELLHWVPAVVAVSSRVDNPRDYPQHLVDGDPATAWNGKSGDLVGGWIAFVVPPAVRVRRIELSAGFDKAGKRGDFFAMNHRITKVAVERRDGGDGPSSWRRIREVSLDPAVRTPQAIEIDEAGGRFRIEVLEVTPGTKPAWKELVVSELRVFGLAGSHRLAKARTPDMLIAPDRDLAGVEPPQFVAEPDAGAPEVETSPPLRGRTAAEVCAAWTKRIAPFLASEYPEERYPGPPEPPFCTIGGPLDPKLVTSGRLKALRTATLAAAYTREHRLAIETAEGVVVPRGALVQAEPYDRGIHGEEIAEVLGARVEGDTVVVRAAVTYRDAHWCVGDPGSWSKQRKWSFELRCPIDGDEPCARVETDVRCSEVGGKPIPCEEVL